MMQTRVLRRGSLARRIEWEGVGAGVGETGELALPAALARFSEVVVIISGRGDQRFALGFRDQAGGDTDGAAGVEHMDYRPLVRRIDPEGRVRLAGRRTAD